ncbi:ATP-binding protein [Croceicoccus bisphenolivorans]|uniref:ATP-binding protein n=1 Tax=Croceicoccus bisphenolivorans TaxID=1783232 RepID=UPI00082F4B85|nr:ATP-binding protein [Croceicoccus bisphenolivorans]
MLQQPTITAADARFNRKLAGPARTLRHCLDALKRGDRAVVLTARRASERRALLAEVARLAGPGIRLLADIDGGEVAGTLGARLASHGIARIAPFDRGRQVRRTTAAGALLIVDNAHMLSPQDIALLANLGEGGACAPVQVVIAGSAHLFGVLCRPEADPLWRQVRLAIAMEEAAMPEGISDIATLEAEISRTRARLEAQQRILSIFADSPAPALRPKV